MGRSLRLLIVEDSEDDALLLVEELRQAGYLPDFKRIETAPELETALRQGSWDLVLADYRLPRFSAPAALALVQQTGIDIPFILVSGAIGEETAVAAMKAGAHDFIMKKSLARLTPAVARELREAEERRQRRDVERALKARTEELEQVVAELRREVAEREQAEQALALQKTELLRSNEELERFAYVCSHDLQEPLRMVISFTNLLAKRYGKTLDADAQEFIHFAVDGASRMQQLIKDLLTYSRIGKEHNSVSQIDSEAALNAALENLREAIENSRATITHDTLPVINANATHLVQLFQNLIGNAIKFRHSTPPLIHVSAKLSPEEEGTAKSAWTFSVRDNGIGIDPAYADRIFDIFERLHAKGEYEGSGIGLAICKKIVEQHGGTIWVDSQPGEGSTFDFTIPADTL